MVLMLNIFLLKYLEKLVYDNCNIFLAVSFAAPVGNEQRLVQQQNAWNTYCIAMLGGFCFVGLFFFSPRFFQGSITALFTGYNGYETESSFWETGHYYSPVRWYQLWPQTWNICVDRCVFCLIWCSVILQSANPLCGRQCLGMMLFA